MVIAAKGASQMLLHMVVASIVEPLCNVLLLPLHDRLWRRIARRRARKGLPQLRPEGA